MEAVRQIIWEGAIKYLVITFYIQNNIKNNKIVKPVYLDVKAK